MMQVSFEIKERNPESSMNRLNLFNFFIYLFIYFFCLTSFIFWEMCDLFFGFFILTFIILVSNYLCRLFRKFRNNLFKECGQNWLVPSSKWTSSNVELNNDFFARSFLKSCFSTSYFCFKVTSLCSLFVAILKTVHKWLSFTH